MALTSACVGAGVLVLAMWPGVKPITAQSGDGPRTSASPSPAPSPPVRPPLAPGIYHIRTADGLCVVDRRPADQHGMTGDDPFYQTPCTTRKSSQVRLEEQDGAYRIVLPGTRGEPDRCWGIDAASVMDGASATFQHCGMDHGALEAELFTLEKVTAHGGGFRIRPKHLSLVPQAQRADLCMGYPDGQNQEWSDMFQLQCLPSARQIFEFLP